MSRAFAPHSVHSRRAPSTSGASSPDTSLYSSASSRSKSRHTGLVRPDAQTCPKSVGGSCRSPRWPRWSTWCNRGPSTLAVPAWDVYASYFRPPPPAAVPVVDRSVVAQLVALEQQLGDDDDEQAEQDDGGGDPDEARYLNLQVGPANRRAWTRSQSPYALPKVPAPVGPQRKVRTRPSSEVDAEHCTTPSGCRFLLVGFIGEQETKGQQHLYQLGLLAAALNRTLVLPNVIRSRLGSCYANPFSYYYAPQSLEQLGIASITQADFLDWVNTREDEPSAQVVSVVNPKPGYPQGAVEIDAKAEPSIVLSKPDRKLCLQKPKSWLRFADFSPIAMSPPDNWNKQDDTRAAFGEGIIHTLSSPDVLVQVSRLQPKPKPWTAREPDVVVFNYEVRYPILSSDMLQTLAENEKISTSADLRALRPFAHFAYAPAWLTLAKDVASSLHPFVAIHWRQETLPVEALQPCTDALLATLRDIAQRLPLLKTVYLATDYPLEDLEAGKDNVVAHSGTFAKLLTEDHHRAMRTLLRAFAADEVAGLKLTTYEREQKAGRLPLPAEAAEGTHVDLGKLDSGLLGIVDKNVAMAAEVFLTAVPDVCGKESSFTRQIVQDRQKRFDAQMGRDGHAVDMQPGKLWDAVQYWSNES